MAKKTSEELNLGFIEHAQKMTNQGIKKGTFRWVWGNVNFIHREFKRRGIKPKWKLNGIIELIAIPMYSFLILKDYVRQKLKGKDKV